MKQIWMIVVLLCFLLTGCSSWMNGHYASITPHMEQNRQPNGGITAVSNSQDIRNALINMIESAAESRTISVESMEAGSVDSAVQLAIRYIKANNPLAAYAVEDIRYETGITGGIPAVVFTVEYNHNRTQIQRIRQVQDMGKVKDIICAALDELEPSIVLQISNYRETDFDQLVENYALLQPDEVMEIPQVTANVYPQSGLIRVVELNFTYQNSREALRQMQRYVQPRFTSASLYVSGDEEESVKFARLYAFLMETASYTVETSITPAYSLLRHSVGDSKAFATVYAAMCRRSGLDCQLVTGSKFGEPWFWNIICEDDVYYHVDLLRASAAGGYQKLADADMEGYVWDYTSYPQCGMTEE